MLGLAPLSATPLSGGPTGQAGAAGIAFIVDRVGIHRGDPALNTAIVTTGLVPLTLGSIETFALQPTLNGVPWDLTGGVVTLTLADPTGALTTVSAVVTGFTAQAGWTVTGLVGQWTRAWRVQDAGGLVQWSRPIAFDVLSSPA